MSQPLVSVITIFLDAERFIEEAIESVFAQTWPHWELLLVDDGSSDRSTTIAKAYAARHPERVRYLEHPGHVNRGMSASRNLGLAHARGELIAFLDADDVYLAERLARHVEVLEAMPQLDMVQSRYLMWYSWQQEGQRLDDDHLGPCFPLFDRPIAPPLCLRLLLSVPFYTPGLHNATVRRQAALDVGGSEDAFRGPFEDTVFFVKLYLSKTTFIIRDCLVKYRRHPWSFTRRWKADGTLESGGAAERAYHQWLERYMTERGIVHPAIWQAVRSQRERYPHPFRRRIHGLHGRAQSVLRAGLQAALPPRVYLALARRQRLRQEQAAAARLAPLLEEIPA